MKVKRKTMAQPQDLPLPLSMKLFLPCQVWNFSPLLLFTFFSPFFFEVFLPPLSSSTSSFYNEGKPPLNCHVRWRWWWSWTLLLFFFCYINFFFFWKSDVREGDLRPTVASPTPCTDREGSWVEANVRPPQLPYSHWLATLSINWLPAISIVV